MYLKYLKIQPLRISVSYLRYILSSPTLKCLVYKIPPSIFLETNSKFLLTNPLRNLTTIPISPVRSRGNAIAFEREREREV